MNILDRVLFEVKIGDTVVKTEIMPGTPYAVLHQALSLMDEYVMKKIQDAEAAKPAAEVPVEVIEESKG